MAREVGQVVPDVAPNVRIDLINGLASSDTIEEPQEERPTVIMITNILNFGVVGIE